MKLKLSIVADSLLYCIVSVFMMPEKMWGGGGGGGLFKNEGTFTYGVVSGRSGSGLYGI